MDELTYGVFRLGQIWSVVGGDGVKLGFPSRADALAAAHELVAARQAGGRDAVIAVQDDLGLLTTLRPSRG